MVIVTRLMHVLRLIVARWLPWVVLSLSLGGCSYLDERSLKWTEDVRLPDGRIVTLTRLQDFRDAHRDPGDYWFEYKDPDNSQSIRWQSDRGLSTLVLFKFEGETFLLLTFGYGTVTYRKYNCPNPPYVLNKYVGNAWKQVDIKDIPLKKLAVNMTYSVFDDYKKIKEKGNHLRVADTQHYRFGGENWPPYVIDFGLMKAQTFGLANCDSKRTHLIAQ